MEVRNKRLSDEEFFKERKEVLAEWPTGKECNLDEAVAYHKSMPPSKNYALKLDEADHAGKVLFQINSGRSTIESHTELLRYCQEAGADLLTTWIDALTRNHHYEAAEEAVKEAERTGKQVLNGFPVVHYGVAGTRKVIDALDNPVCEFANGPDMRLITEIGIAGGHTSSTMGGAINAISEYTRDLPPEVTIRNYQYRYRLIGIYEERGVPLHTNVPGLLQWPVVPPSVCCATHILEHLIAAEQGVKHIGGVAGSLSGNWALDFAGSICGQKLCAEYLNRFGYKDVVMTRVGGSAPAGRWPPDEAQAFARVCYPVFGDWLCGSQVVGVTSLDEARAIPAKENSSASLRCARMFFNLLKDQKQIFDYRDNKEVEVEAEVLEREIRAILDRVIELGDGDVVVGTIRGFEAGVIDHPWVTSKYLAGRVLGVRDAHGAIRWFDHGSLPFSQDIIDFHKEKIAEREKALGRKVDYDTIVADIGAVSKGSLLPEPWWEEEETGVPA